MIDNKDTFFSGITNELVFTRPFLKKVNFQSHNSPRLMFQTWFSAKENCHLTWVPVT